MEKKQEPLAKLKRSKSNVKFPDLVKILSSIGYVEQNVVGSHYIFGKQGALPILIVKPHGNKKTCHPRDVNKVIKILEVIKSEQKEY